MMKSTYNVGQRCIAYLLLVSLLLQSCSGPAISTKPVDLAIEPTTLIELSQQIFEHPVEDIAGVYQPISDALAHTTAADLAITQSSFKEENIQLQRLALEPGEQIQKTTSSIATESFVVKTAGALPGRVTQQAHDSKKQVRNSQARLVSQQKLLQDNQVINRQEKSNSFKYELSSQAFQTKPGQKVSFYAEAGLWKAKVQETFGILRRNLVLPVYFEGLSLPTNLHTSRIHVVEADKATGKKGYVYVGRLGLLGGMVKDEDEGQEWDNARIYIRVAKSSQLIQTAKQGDAKAQYKLGKKYEKKENYTEAIAWYEKAAAKEHTEAQFDLGMMYKNGNGVDPDYTKAREWFEKAADQGDHVSAQYMLGELYAEGKGVDQDYEQAISWYQKAADKGHIWAQFNLGMLYSKAKEGLTPNYTKAREWFKKAADQGNIEAQYNLGMMYENGKGVAQDYPEALVWYEKAAEKGHKESQHKLGIIYQNGDGVTPDHTKAIYWYQKAARKGHMLAQTNLVLMYKSITDVGTGYVQAIGWYKKAAEKKMTSRHSIYWEKCTLMGRV